MKEKIGIWLLFIILTILCSGTAFAKTITVDNSGGCDYTSIQDAIDDNIKYDEMGVEYYITDLTIIVYPGIYNESINLKYPINLKAYSLNPADTVIESEGYAIDIKNNYRDSGSYSIDGFTIKGDVAGINYIQGDYVIYMTIENNIITGGNCGVSLYICVPTIKNNKFERNNNGIYLDDCSPLEIVENDFTDNNVGIYARTPGNVKNNLFTGNGVAIFSIDGGLQITDNIIRDNKAGIDSIGGDLITSNVITGNIEYGVESRHNEIYNNIFNNEVNLIPHYGDIFSIEATEGPNIIGGPYIGGNFWGKPDGTGFSQTCPDADSNGFCDEPYVINNDPDDPFLNLVDYLPLKEVTPSEPILPVANFNSNVTEGYVPFSVQFTDLSEDATGWNWDFGDGVTSIEQSPMHTYSAAGTYTVNLTANNANGTNSIFATISVLKVTPTITWSSPTDIISGTALSNTQLNAIASVLGTFVYTPEEGTVLSVDTQILHVDFTPDDATNYTAASKDVTINVSEKPVIPVADFYASPTTGKAPLIVTFADKSTGSPTSWSWNFGDKSTSTDQNPVHEYKKAGKYTVSLTVKNALGSNTKKITNYIVVTNK